jgi:hypothetical protein
MVPPSLKLRCNDWVRLVSDAFTLHVQSGDVVALATATYKHYKWPVDLQIEMNFIHNFSDWLAQRGASLIILDDGPVLPKHGFSCVSPGTIKDCQVNKSIEVIQRYKATTAFDKLENSTSNVIYFKVFDLMCEGDICGSRVPGKDTLLYYDKDHWSFEGSLFIAPYLACQLQALFPSKTSQCFS